MLLITVVSRAPFKIPAPEKDEEILIFLIYKVNPPKSSPLLTSSFRVTYPGS